MNDNRNVGNFFFAVERETSQIRCRPRRFDSEPAGLSGTPSDSYTVHTTHLGWVLVHRLRRARQLLCYRELWGLVVGGCAVSVLGGSNQFVRGRSSAHPTKDAGSPESWQRTGWRSLLIAP